MKRGPAEASGKVKCPQGAWRTRWARRARRGRRGGGEGARCGKACGVERFHEKRPTVVLQGAVGLGTAVQVHEGRMAVVLEIERISAEPDAGGKKHFKTPHV